VTGAGVVGEQPRLEPGDTYEYSSGCPLDTPSGLMFGHYQMETAEGEFFDVEIPAFSLDSPGLLRVLN
jgi:ApaG protein